MSQPDDNPQVEPEQESSAQADATRIADRFVLQKLLGRGASSSVYSAYDEQRREVVALKFLTALDPGSLFRFKSEFRLLTNLAHANLLQLYDLTSDGTNWLLSMELIDGENFLDFVRPSLASRSTPPTDATESSFDLDPPTADLGLDADTLASLEDSSTQPSVAEELNPSGDAAPGELPAPAPAEQNDSSTPAPSLTPMPQLVLDSALRPLDHARLRKVLLQLADGLHALHCAARLHRDIKPANLLVAKADGRLVICDFGLAIQGSQFQARLSRRSTPANDLVFDTRREIAGTPVFMSPEQISGDPLTVASDWYSVGVLLYVALTAHVPMRMELTRTGAAAFLAKRPPIADPRTLDRSVPDRLAELTLRLLDPTPRKRAGYRDVVAAFSGSGYRGAKPESFHYTGFLGRESELSHLQEALDATRAGTPAVALLYGASGMGKSALARHFLDKLESSADALVLRGRCYEHEQMPFKTLDPIVDALTTHLLSETRAELSSLLPADIEQLAGVFPTLKRVPAVAERPSSKVVDPRERRRLAFQALRELFTNLARKRPLVIFVDDLQWGDSDSASAILQVLRPPAAPSLLLLCAYRKEEEPRAALLRSLRDMPQKGWTLPLVEVPVEPLGAAAAERLALEILREMPKAPQIASRIASESEGNPLFIAQLARHVATHGADSAVHLRLDDLISAKLEALPRELKDLLAVIALSGRPVAHSTLRAAYSKNLARGLRELDLHAFTLSRRHDKENYAECFHNRIRENVVRGLSAAERRRLHLALAQALEQSASADLTALLEHWKGAGDSERAHVYAVKAAEAAASTLAFTRAAELYRQALELGEQPASRAVELRERLGRALVMAGRGVEAASVFLELIPQADPRQAVEYRMLASTQLLRGGKLAEGFTELERAGSAFGVSFPRSGLQAVTSLLWRRARIRLRERKLVVHEADQPLGDQRAWLEALWEVAAALASADFLRGSVYSAELMLRVAPSGDPTLLAAALGFQAIEAAAADRPARAQRLIDLAERASLASSQDFMIGRVRGMIAICRQLQGRWLESVSLARESQTMQQRASRLNWDHAIMIWWELQSASQAGQISLVKQRVPEALRDADVRGDVYAATSFRTHRSSWAWLAMDRPDLAEAEVERAERAWNPIGYQFQHWHMTYARAETDLYRRTPHASFERLNREWSRARLTRQVNGVRVDMLYTRARLMLAMALLDKHSGRLSRARGDAHLLMKEPAPWAVGLGLLVLAGVAALEDVARARELLQQAESKLRSVDMPLHAEVARARRAQLDRDSATLADSLGEIHALGVDKPERFLDLLLPLSAA